MSDYTRTIIFAVKDALLTGDPNKVVRGIELDVELDASQTAINSKFDLSDMATQAEAEAGLSFDTLMSPLTTKQAFDFFALDWEPVGDFVKITGDQMTGTLDMLGETKIQLYSDIPGTIKRIEMFTSGFGQSIERSGVRLFDQYGNDGNTPGATEELVSIRTENDTGTDILRSAVVAQRNKATLSSTQNWSGLIGFNNVRDEDFDDANFFLQNESGVRKTWLGTAWEQDKGLSSSQLHICRPSNASSVNFIELMWGATCDNPVFTVDATGSVDIPVGQSYKVGGVDIVTGGGGLPVGVDGDILVNVSGNWEVAADLKFWDNPNFPGERELALLNDRQFAVYTTGDSSSIEFELVGAGTDDNGWRVHQPQLTNTFSTALFSDATTGAASLLMRPPGGSTTQYGFSVVTGAYVTSPALQGGTVVTVNGSIIQEGNSENTFNGTINADGIRMIANGIDMNTTGAGTGYYLYNLRLPEADHHAANKAYVDAQVGAGVYVDLVNNQTVNGTKTFNDTIIADGISMLNNGIDMDNQVLFNPLDPTFSNHVGDRGYNDGRYVLGSASGFVNTSSNQSISGAKTWNTGATFNGTGNAMNGLAMTSNGINMSSRTLFNPANPTASNAVGDRAYNDGRYTLSSDMRLKKDVEDMQGALDLVTTLRTFSYEYNDVMPVSDMKTGRRYGISAQEIQDTFPLAAKDNPSNEEYLTVDTDQLIPVLLKAIQELNDKVEALS